MPPRAKNRFNVQYVQWLKDPRNEYDPEDNRYKTYTKAINGLGAATQEYSTPGDLIAVKGIGPMIVGALKKRYAQENGVPSSSQPGPSSPAPKPRGRPPKRSATEVDIGPPPAAKRRTVSAAALPAQAPIATQTAAEFQFWYLDGDEKHVRRQADALTSITEDHMLKFKIAYPDSQANCFLVAQFLGRQRRGDIWVAEMREDIAQAFPECPGFESAPKLAPANSNLSAALRVEEEERASQKRSTNDPSRQLPQYLRNGFNATASSSRSSSSSDMRQAAAARSYTGTLSQASRASSPPPIASTSFRPLVRAVTTTAVPSASSASTFHRTASAPNPLPARPRLSHAVRAPAPVEHPSLYMPQTSFPDFAPRIFRAGTYSITLLLDHRETGGRKHQDIGTTLRQKGVSVEERALSLGDVAWAATNGVEECLLDVVLERKRLDDLVISIKDGRFHEQKFRLKQTGISCVFYLVESYDAARQKAEWGPQISTALSSTQAVDEFMVKETKNINDTIAWLTGLTEQLNRDHQTKDLYVIPNHMIKRHSYVDLQKFLRRKYPDRCYVTSFADFQTLNHKSGFTTVRDTWTKMLLRVKGMSAEKVGAVVAKWDTPRALWEAFQVAELEEHKARVREEQEEEEAAGPSKGKGRKKKSNVPEAKLMLQGVGGAEGGVRAIGPALSTTLYELFMADNYD
ncbi:ERCC4 domain-containing protein [Mycena crocata]|nr:ERCC4 domain-containing protein [Mycena crocata]